MRALALMKKMELDTPLKGVSGLMLDTGVGAAASYGIGRLYAQKGDKWYGKRAAHLAAGVGKLGAVAVSLMSGGHATFLGGSLNAVGQAGVDAYFLEKGLRHGREKMGKRGVNLPRGAALPAGAEEQTSIGALGAAPAGRGLSWDQIQELAEGH